MPPLGTVFLAWAGGSAIEAWLARIDDAPDEQGASHLRSLAGVRARGYAVGLEVATRGQLGRALIESTDYPRADQSHERIAALVAQLGREQYVLDDGPTEHNEVSLIAAPVFGPAGDVVLALSAVGFTAPLARDEIDHIGTLLRRATGRVTDATFGRPPT
jgi:DNA-binding IclR family transcriptional regulator